MRFLADTSAWVEYLRDTGSQVCETLDQAIRSSSMVATTDVVIMELLQGGPTRKTQDKVWGLMNWCVMYPTRPLFDYEVAADLYHRCRGAGFTPANSNDLLVAAVAIGKDLPLLAADSDFESIASVSSLRLVSI